jgi:hypothetical protein
LLLCKTSEDHSSTLIIRGRLVAFGQVLLLDLVEKESDLLKTEA